MKGKLTLNNNVLLDIENYLHKSSDVNVIDLPVYQKRHNSNLVSVNGFGAICVFHQFIGLPYYGMTRSSCNIFRNFSGIIFSLIFIGIFIGMC